MYLRLAAAIERHRGFLVAHGFGPHFPCPCIMIFVLPGTVARGVAVGVGVCEENKVHQTPKMVGCNVMQDAVGFHVEVECTGMYASLQDLERKSSS